MSDDTSYRITLSQNTTLSFRVIFNVKKFLPLSVMFNLYHHNATNSFICYRWQISLCYLFQSPECQSRDNSHVSYVASENVRCTVDRDIKKNAVPTFNHPEEWAGLNTQNRYEL